MPYKFTRKIIAAAALALLTCWPAATQAGASSTLSTANIPAYSASPVSNGREPVTFMYVGTEAQITQLFTSHGWSGADPISASSLLKAYQAAKANAPYPTAPFSPAFINGQTQDLSFQLPTAANTIAQRHHTRIWLASTTASDGRSVWVGTASFDTSLAMIGQAILPVHHIDPNLPAERSYILHSLGITQEKYVQLQTAQTGANSFGDPYTTDGLAAVINLDAVTPSSAPLPTATPVPAATSPTPPSGLLGALQNTFSRFTALWQ